jgi:hypothetical protein
MRIRHLLAILVLACLYAGPLIPSQVNAQTQPRFQIGGFVVQVNVATLSVNGAHPPSAPVLSASNPSQFNNEVFAGEGSTSLHGVTLGVTFRQVRLRVATGRLIATDGIVSGKTGADIQYRLNALNIRIARPSVSITPPYARAQVAVTVPVANFSASTQNSLTISSNVCSIFPDGSINGSDFHGAASLPLKDSLYSLRIRAADLQSVRAGPAFSVRGASPAFGVKFRGVASRESAEVFSFDGTVSPDAAVISFNLQLNQLLQAYPEDHYELDLKKGQVDPSSF